MSLDESVNEWKTEPMEISKATFPFIKVEDIFLKDEFNTTPYNRQHIGQKSDTFDVKQVYPDTEHLVDDIGSQQSAFVDHTLITTFAMGDDKESLSIFEEEIIDDVDKIKHVSLDTTEYLILKDEPEQHCSNSSVIDNRLLVNINYDIANIKKIKSNSDNVDKHKISDCCTKSCSLAHIKSNFVKHIRTHTDKKSCDHSSCKELNLVSHIKPHTGKSSFMCDLCDYSSYKKSNVVQHIRTHTGIKLYKCNICDYSSCKKSNLSQHIKTHTGDRPFKCNLCDYSASRNFHLVQHGKTHSGEKPFKCELCGYSSSNKSNLVRHFKTRARNKQFNCSQPNM